MYYYWKEIKNNEAKGANAHNKNDDMKMSGGK